MAGCFAFAERQGHLTSCIKISSQLYNYLSKWKWTDKLYPIWFRYKRMAYTRENKIIYLPCHMAFRRYFSLIFHITANIKLKVNSSVTKLFKETVHLPKLFEMHLFTFLIFPISQKKSREFLHDPLCFMTLLYVPSVYLLFLRSRKYWPKIYFIL